MAALPVRGGETRLGHGIDVIGQRQRHHIGLQSIYHGASLLAGATVRLANHHIIASLGFPLLGEGAVICLEQLAGRIVGDVEQTDLGGIGLAECQQG
ncbi:hypothetical protein D3C78_1320970 [compost metagenome]